MAQMGPVLVQMDKAVTFFLLFFLFSFFSLLFLTFFYFRSLFLSFPFFLSFALYFFFYSQGPQGAPKFGSTLNLIFLL